MNNRADISSYKPQNYKKIHSKFNKKADKNIKGHREQRSLKKSLREILNEKNIEKIEKKFNKKQRRTLSLNASKSSNYSHKQSIVIQDCQQDSEIQRIKDSIFRSNFLKSKSLASIKKINQIDDKSITERRKTSLKLDENRLIHNSLQNIAHMSYLMGASYHTNGRKQKKSMYSDFKKNCFFKNFSKNRLKTLGTPCFNGVKNLGYVGGVFKHVGGEIGVEEDVSFSKKKDGVVDKYLIFGGNDKENNINESNAFISARYKSSKFLEKNNKSKTSRIKVPNRELINSQHLMSPSKVLYLKTKNSKSVNFSKKSSRRIFQKKEEEEKPKVVSTLRANTFFNSKKSSGYAKSFAIRTFKNEHIGDKQGSYVRVSAHFTSKSDKGGKIPITYFGVFRGVETAFCANFMKDNLRRFIFGSKHFPGNLTMAIRYGFKKASKAFLKLQEISSGKSNEAKGRASALVYLSVGNTTHFLFHFFLKNYLFFYRQHCSSGYDREAQGGTKQVRRECSQPD